MTRRVERHCHVASLDVLNRNKHRYASTVKAADYYQNSFFTWGVGFRSDWLSATRYPKPTGRSSTTIALKMDIAMVLRKLSHPIKSSSLNILMKASLAGRVFTR